MSEEEYNNYVERESNKDLEYLTDWVEYQKMKKLECIRW